MPPSEGIVVAMQKQHPSCHQEDRVKRGSGVQGSETSQSCLFWPWALPPVEIMLTAEVRRPIESLQHTAAWQVPNDNAGLLTR